MSRSTYRATRPHAWSTLPEIILQRAPTRTSRSDGSFATAMGNRKPVSSASTCARTWEPRDALSSERTTQRPSRPLPVRPNEKPEGDAFTASISKSHVATAPFAAVADLGAARSGGRSPSAPESAERAAELAAAPGALPVLRLHAVSPTSSTKGRVLVMRFSQASTPRGIDKKSAVPPRSGCRRRPRG